VTDIPLGRPVEGNPTYLGGLRLRNVFLNFGWPGARLVLLDEGVWMGPSTGLFRPFVPVRRFRFDEPCEIQAIGSSWITSGIRFHSLATDRWAIFWAWPARRAEILKQLALLTDRINPEPERLTNYLNPGPD
jgi:hypothetical protein